MYSDTSYHCIKIQDTCIEDTAKPCMYRILITLEVFKIFNYYDFMNM